MTGLRSLLPSRAAARHWSTLPGGCRTLELGWAMPGERLFYEALGDGRTLIRYDRPGSGLSGPAPDDDLVAVEMSVLDALLRTLGVARADVLGIVALAPLAVLAARRPETVDRLVLYGGWAEGRSGSVAGAA